MQPRQLAALVKRYEREQWATEFMFAQLTAMSVNFSMAHPKKPVEPRDFMPSEWAKTARAEQKPPKNRNRQTIATEIRTAMANWLKGENG